MHAGQEPDPSTGAIIVPIYQTSTYVQEALGQHKGYEYARTQNPTRSAFEANIAAIENGKAAFGFASGMAATGAVMTLLESGDHAQSRGLAAARRPQQGEELAIGDGEVDVGNRVDLGSGPGRTEALRDVAQLDGDIAHQESIQTVGKKAAGRGGCAPPFSLRRNYSVAFTLVQPSW